MVLELQKINKSYLLEQIHFIQEEEEMILKFKLILIQYPVNKQDFNLCNNINVYIIVEEHGMQQMDVLKKNHQMELGFNYKQQMKKKISQKANNFH